MLRAVRWRDSSGVMCKGHLENGDICCNGPKALFRSQQLTGSSVFRVYDTNEGERFAAPFRMYGRRASQPGEENNGWITIDRRDALEIRLVQRSSICISRRGIENIRGVIAASSIRDDKSLGMHLANSRRVFFYHEYDIKATFSRDRWHSEPEKSVILNPRNRPSVLGHRDICYSRF